MAYLTKILPSERQQNNRLPAIMPIGDNEDYNLRHDTAYGAEAFVLPIALDALMQSMLVPHPRLFPRGEV